MDLLRQVRREAKVVWVWGKVNLKWQRRSLCLFQSHLTKGSIERCPWQPNPRSCTLQTRLIVEWATAHWRVMLGITQHLLVEKCPLR